ncbi:MAG: hypothetical protein KKB62_00665 [Nanoarchaeota archaeon]|nr:hypothetical protein [Nanoarchaeota archaeon]
MEVIVVGEKENLIFSRKEIQLDVTSNVVPKREEVANWIAKKFSTGEDLVRVNKIKGKFGVQVFRVDADVYSSKEEFKRVVKKTKQEIEKEKKTAEEKKKAETEAKKAEAEEKAKAEEKKEEKPAEEVKEEKSE